jgi:ketosteroid isomerase-like protein
METEHDMQMRCCRAFTQRAFTQRVFIQRAFTQRMLAALVLCSLCCAGLAARGQLKDGLYTATHQQLDVVKIVLAQEDAWNRGDLDGFLSRLKDDPETLAVLATRIKGVGNIRSAFRINFPNHESMGTIAYSDVEARELGEKFALATGKYHLERSKKGGGPADGTFTEIMEKTPQGWMIIFNETT